jgi:hypothetical protein
MSIHWVAHWGLSWCLCGQAKVLLTLAGCIGWRDDTICISGRKRCIKTPAGINEKILANQLSSAMAWRLKYSFRKDANCGSTPVFFYDPDTRIT